MAGRLGKEVFRKKDATMIDLGMKWISVTDELPDEIYKDGGTHWVIVARSDQGLWWVESARYNHVEKEWQGGRFSSQVTHWMPMPRPPKEHEVEKENVDKG